MASLAAVSHNSEQAGSAKERHFFKREELQEFFETCPPNLVPFAELRTLYGMWKAAGKPFGAEIQFFKAIKHYCKGGQYKSESTVRSNIRRAEDSGVLEVAYRDRRGNCHHIWIRQRTNEDRGLYRRVTTHRLSIPLLLKWRSERKQHGEAKVEPIRKPAQASAEATAKPAPSMERTKPPEHHRQMGTRPEKRARELRASIMADMTALMKSGHSQSDALKQVCASSGVTVAQAEEILKLMSFTPPAPRGSPVETRSDFGSRCQKCGGNLAQNFGPGPRLICPKCGVKT